MPTTNIQDYLEVILQNIADGITVQRASGEVVYLNDMGAKMCGFISAEQMLIADPVTRTEHLKRFIIYDEQGQIVPWEQLPGRRALAGEKQPEAILRYHNTITGQDLWSHVKARPILDKEGRIQFAVNIISDITQARDVAQRKDEFISIASHELKTPLTILKLYTELLQQKIQQLSVMEVRSYISKMNQQLNRVSDLIRDLLDVSHLQSGLLPLKKRPVKMISLVQQVITEVQQISPARDIQLNIEGSGTVFADPERLRQVLENLLLNACKYSPVHSVIQVKLCTQGAQLEISVKDAGIGIAPEHQTKIFSRFFQVQNLTQHKAGLGLGLYIAAHIIKQHEGTIWVESLPNQGATFFVRLPLDLAYATDSVAFG